MPLAFVVIVTVPFTVHNVCHSLQKNAIVSVNCCQPLFFELQKTHFFIICFEKICLQCSSSSKSLIKRLKNCNLHKNKTQNVRKRLLSSVLYLPQCASRQLVGLGTSVLGSDWGLKPGF